MNLLQNKSPWGPRCRIVIALTLDYEIFHGRNFVSDEETLFAPTDRILDRASAQGVPVTLFADVCSVWRHRDIGLHAFADHFEQQLVRAQAREHDVQLHVHAHWARANLSNGSWRLREPKFTLADLGFSSDEPAQIVRRGVEYLQELLRTSDPLYRCLAFRAGGLALQSNERDLIRILRTNGIVIDSSIAKDYTLDLETVRIDYRNMPEAPNWTISQAGGLRSGSKPGLFEVPIASFPMGLKERITFLAGRARSIRERRGASLSGGRQTRLSNLATMIRGNIRYLAGSPSFLFSADTKGLNRSMIVNGFKSYVDRHAARSPATPMFVSMINHPKLMFPKQERLMFDALAELKEHYGDALHFATFPQIAAFEEAHA
jgi:hypothetical protein